MTTVSICSKGGKKQREGMDAWIMAWDESERERERESSRSPNGRRSSTSIVQKRLKAPRRASAIGHALHKQFFLFLLHYFASGKADVCLLLIIFSHPLNCANNSISLSGSEDGIWGVPGFLRKSLSPLISGTLQKKPGFDVSATPLPCHRWPQCNSQSLDGTG